MSAGRVLALWSAAALVSSAGAQESLLREAARLDGEHRCEEAERFYRQALAKGPPSTALLNNFGNHFVACGQSEQSRQWFERLLRLNPGHLNASLQLARIEIDQKHGAKALEHLKRLDESEVVRLLRAEALQSSGQSAAASAILDRLDREAKGDPRRLFALGMACARMERYDQAESAFNRLLSIYPQDFDVLMNLGRAAARANHHDRAQRALEAALRIQPGDADALVELGLSHASRQDYARAVFLLAQAGERAPKRPEIQLALAHAAEAASYYGDAALAYDRYLNLRPEDEIAVRDRALILGLSDARPSEGLQALESYVRRRPADAVGHYDLAQLLWRSSPERALAELTAAVRASANFAPARLARGWLLYRLGRPAEALPDLLAADRTSPKNPRILAQIGLTYTAIDRHADAEKVLKQALALVPGDPEILLYLGRCLMEMDRVDEAQGFLNTFQKVRPQSIRGPRKEAGLIEMASMPAAERIRRDIDRLRREAATHPGDPELRLNLGTLLLAEGELNAAVHEFRELLSGRADPALLRKAGAALMAAGKYAPAKELLERAAQEDEQARIDLAWAVFSMDGMPTALEMLKRVPAASRGADYLLMRARILDAVGQTPEAAGILQKGLQQHPSHTEFARQASFLLLRQGQAGQAIELLNRAIQKSPGDPDLLLRLALALAVQGDSLAAEKRLREIEAKWPEWERAYLLHGVILERVRPAEARQKFRTAVALGIAGGVGECAKERIEPSHRPDLNCACFAGPLDWFRGECSGQLVHGEKDPGR
ncbi:MAG TPA: tetratricopeptide repeat protein [Bryobacteraceae bacterium]|nr:tetratricopeptide repeat protein [Bryobacteraceae bacterium]